MGTSSKSASGKAQASADRLISLGDGLARIPERLLLAHARGEVLFLVGAGVSRASDLPDFGGLVKQIFAEFDLPVYEFLKIARDDVTFLADLAGSSFTDQQRAEVKRFRSGDYDVVLGMLERRIEGLVPTSSEIRLSIAKMLRGPKIKYAPIHRSLIKLSNRGVATTVVTTNFEFLLEAAARSIGVNVKTFALGGIPRPGLRKDFSGVLHIHGALDRDPNRSGDLIVSDHDFGEFYLRRRVVPDFIYDAARLYNIVLVGYSANDPPMRYLLNAVAADGSRFGDLKERFTFVGVDSPDPVLMEDWKGRGITPIEYDNKSGHAALAVTLNRWASLSAHNATQTKIESFIRNAVKKKRAITDDSTRDLFDHLFRRSDPLERTRLAELASKSGADLEWLDAIVSLASEVEGSN